MLPKVPEPPMPGKHTIFVNPNFNRGGVTQFPNATSSRTITTNVDAINYQHYNVKPHVNPLFLKQKFLPPTTNPIVQTSLLQPRPLPASTSIQTPHSIQPNITPTIHMNPKVFFINPLFVQKNLLQQQQQKLQQHQQLEQQQHLHQQPNEIIKANAPTYNSGYINVGIVNSYSAQATKENCRLVTSNAARMEAPPPASTGAATLLHLSKRKLVRKPVECSTGTISIIKPISIKANTKLDISNPKKRYKIDRTKTSEAAPVVPIPKPKLLSKAIDKKKYVLKNKPETILKLAKSSKRITPMKLINNNMHKLVRINNILYKTTHNKLLRKDLQESVSVKTSTSITTSKNMSYYLKTASNLKTRHHISSAKNKSMTQLRKRFVKSNEPCLVFQRLGKCAAFDKGRCNKNHNKEQVVICPKYLRGECFNAACLLSHNVCLAKMPVCKFYLQANCFRDNCPYLHKKLSKKAEVCMDFVRGYCERAGKCNKRHEFICPALAANKICVQTNCLFCKPRSQFKSTSKATAKAATSKTKQKLPNNESNASKAKPTLANPAKTQEKEKKIPESVNEKEKKKEEEEKPAEDQNHLIRYFEAAPQALEVSQDPEAQPENKNEAEASVVVGRKRPKLGQLPAFIPLY